MLKHLALISFISISSSAAANDNPCRAAYSPIMRIGIIINKTPRDPDTKYGMSEEIAQLATTRIKELFAIAYQNSIGCDCNELNTKLKVLSSKANAVQASTAQDQIAMLNFARKHLPEVNEDIVTCSQKAQ